MCVLWASNLCSCLVRALVFGVHKSCCCWDWMPKWLKQVFLFSLVSIMYLNLWPACECWPRLKLTVSHWPFQKQFNTFWSEFFWVPSIRGHLHYVWQRASGLMAGSVTTFFGFIGFDEVCCMAGEARWTLHTEVKPNFDRHEKSIEIIDSIQSLTTGSNIFFSGASICVAFQAVQPQKTVPRALIGTVSIATLLPVIASLALVGRGLK